MKIWISKTSVKIEIDLKLGEKAVPALNSRQKNPRNENRPWPPAYSLPGRDGGVYCCAAVYLLLVRVSMGWCEGGWVDGWVWIGGG